jgi:hypothetical protein
LPDRQKVILPSSRLLTTSAVKGLKEKCLFFQNEITGGEHSVEKISENSIGRLKNL